MSDDPKLREILDQAAELPVEQRGAFLDAACGGNSALRGEVDSLLLALDQAEEFFENPTMSAPAEAPPTAPPVNPIGTRVGPYQLLERLGEGGMGVVYLAEQDKPVRRRVALKIVKPGMDSAAIIARFEAERQALALMDHSNIARIYSAGTTETGRPYFVMELVQGVPITQYCDEHRLPPEQRLELFLTICQAVQHAHQKGIIHRDLKPSNIMVTVQDGKPVAKVIDFGVAKALEQRLTEKTLFTESGMMVGTLEYMSPEQADSVPGATDTRSDVYSLGVILYELLTGTTPLDGRKLRQAGYEQMMRVIRESEPPRPSTRLGSSVETLATVSALRQMQPRKLANLLSGDLDCIVMKCLEKDRARRYDTVSGLARDISRYFDGEAITARPPSTLYQLGKFARRNRVLVTGAAAVAVALLLGTAGTTVGMVRARRAQATADSALVREAEQRRRAEARFGDVRQLANDFMFKFDDQLIKIDGTTPVRRLLADTALKYLDRLSRDAAADRSLDQELSVSYENVGDILGNPYLRNVGDTAGALASYRKTLEIRRRLAAAEPGDADAQMAVASVLDRIGDLQEAGGRWDDALSNYREANVICQKLAAGDLTGSGRWANVATTEEKLGDGLAATGKVTDALKSYNQSLNVREQLARDHPTDFSYQNELAVSYEKLGDLYAANDRHDEALSSYNSALAVCNKMIQAIPDDLDAMRSLAVAHESIGRLQVNNNQPAEALANYEQTLKISQKLAQHNPTDMRAQHDLEVDYVMVGAVQGQYNQPYKALENFALAMPITLMLARNQSDARAKRELAGLHYNIASVDLQIAEQKETPVEERRRRGRAAIEEFHTAKDLFLKMKSDGILASMDEQASSDADVLLRECDDTLAALDRPTSAPTTGPAAALNKR